MIDVDSNATSNVLNHPDNASEGTPQNLTLTQNGEQSERTNRPENTCENIDEITSQLDPIAQPVAVTSQSMIIDEPPCSEELSFSHNSPSEGKIFYSIYNNVKI